MNYVNPWITIAFTPCQQDKVAVWGRLWLDHSHADPLDQIEHGAIRLTKYPVVGVLIQHKLDQNDGIAMASRVVVAVLVGDDVLGVGDVNPGHGAEYLGIFAASTGVTPDELEQFTDELRETHRVALERQAWTQQRGAA